jgi:GWxTD domain-containing protein
VRRWFPALLLLACPATLPGQSGTERVALDRFRESLAALTDLTALARLHRSLARSDDPVAQLRLGLIGLRRHDLGADPDASDACGVLARLVRREPSWPYAWHALADAERRRSAWEQADSLALGSRVGVGSLERALEADRRAVEADPRYIPAAAAMAGLALDLRDTALLVPARDALRRADSAFARTGTDSVSPDHDTAGAAAPPRPSAELLLARGRLERATEALDSAIASFARAQAVAPDPATRAMARLEEARTALARGGPGADRLYFQAATTDDPATVAGYRADLAPIAADSELAGFDAARGAARKAWLERFWGDRDRAELRGDGERLREHYRRLLYARRRFALTVSRRFYGGQDAYRSGSEELDDRGVIYVRHGEPRTRLRPFVFGLMPNETWRYDRADGDLLLHFSAGYDDRGGDLYDYRLVESVLDLRGAAGAPSDQLLLSRQELTPLYGRMLVWGPHGAAGARATERGIGRASIDYGTTTDSYELQFARPLTVYADLVAVGGTGSHPQGQFVFAVGAEGTRPEPAGEGTTYRVRARLVALDGSGHAVAHADTTLGFRLERPLQPRQYLLGRIAVPLPAGRFGWRAAVDQGVAAGKVLPRDSVQVAGARPGLAVSDLALGIRAASVRWHPTPADTVLLTPFDLVLAGSEVELYYEVAGAHPGAGYRHEIAVYRVRRDDRPESRPVVSLHVDEIAGDSVIRAHRVLQLARLKRGDYVVAVTLTGPAGETDVRRRTIRVIEARR